MRILVAISSLRGGGAERAVATLSRVWAERGHDVCVVTLSTSKDDAYYLDARVSRSVLDLERPSHSVLTAIWNNALRVVKLRQEIRRYRPTVIVAFMPPTSIVSAVAAIGTRVRVVGCERTFPQHAPLGPMREAARRWGYGLLDAVTAQTPEAAEWLRVHTWAQTVKVIPNTATWPLPDNEPMVRPENVCRPGRRILLAVGRLEVEKGFLGLLQIFAEICSKHPNWDLVVIGEGSLRDKFERFISEQELTDRAYLPGRVGNMADWYTRADLFVLSSGFEGFPNALVEAMSHGVAPVSYDCDSGPRNIIRDGIDGVLVPNAHPEQLAGTLDRLMTDDEQRRRLSQRATEIRDRLSEDTIAQEWNKLLESTINN